MTTANKEIKRFNLGFGIFGVPEQCEDGEYMSYEDHCDGLVSALEFGAEAIGELQIAHQAKIQLLNEQLKEMTTELEIKNSAHQAKASHDRTRMVACLVVAIVGWGIISIQLVLNSFGG